MCGTNRITAVENANWAEANFTNMVKLAQI